MAGIFFFPIVRVFFLGAVFWLPIVNVWSQVLIMECGCVLPFIRRSVWIEEERIDRVDLARLSSWRSCSEGYFSEHLYGEGRL